ncbi:MAG: hypothetical protein AB201_03400 [Parcubacteria bacterium C7867-006]|nr:MAG: hypothetical protein AB201_03400 [Parcubacteria bacterium C7867-006]
MSSNDRPPEKIDAIVVISYGSTKTRLTRASSEVALKAASLAKEHPESTLYWGFFGKSTFQTTEKFLKDRLFRGLKHICVGSVTSTTDECEAISKYLPNTTQNIVVVVEGCHSRRCMKVWRYFHQNSYVYASSINPIDGSDPGNPMWTQRHWIIWLPVNIILIPLYWGNGPRRMAKVNFSQPTW